MPYLSSGSAYNWTGFYVGATAGASFPAKSNIPILDPRSALPGTRPIPIASANNIDTAPTGGIEAGYNLEVRSFVFGVEGEVYFKGNKNALNGTYSTGLSSIPTVSVSGADKSSVYFSIRGRVGYAIDRALLYVTGGALFGRNSDPTTLVFNPAGGGPPCPTCTFTANGDTNSSLGMVLGGGAEYALTNNWSAKVEYLRNLYGLKKINYTNDFNPGLPRPFDGVQAFNLNGRGMDTDVLRVGLNYKF